MENSVWGRGSGGLGGGGRGGCVPSTQKSLNNPSLFSGWVSHLIHPKASGLSMGRGLGWKLDLRIWMYWKSRHFGGAFEAQCTIAIKPTISYYCDLSLIYFYFFVEPSVPRLRSLNTIIVNFSFSFISTLSSYLSLALTKMLKYHDKWGHLNIVTAGCITRATLDFNENLLLTIFFV